MIINQLNNRNEKRKYNIFLAILRTYLSFNIINIHFLRTPPILMNEYIVRILRNNLPVPIFFLMSFCLSHVFFGQLLFGY